MLNNLAEIDHVESIAVGLLDSEHYAMVIGTVEQIQNRVRILHRMRFILPHVVLVEPFRLSRETTRHPAKRMTTPHCGYGIRIDYTLFGSHRFQALETTYERYFAVCDHLGIPKLYNGKAPAPELGWYVFSYMDKEPVA